MTVHGARSRRSLPGTDRIAPTQQIETQQTKQTNEPPQIEPELKSSPPPRKPRFRLSAGGASLFGRIGAISVVGALLGTMIGDPEATGTGRQIEETRPPIVESVETRPAEASYVADAVRRASRLLAPLGLEGSDLLSALTNVSISVQVDREHLLRDNPSSGLQIRPGTRVNTYVDRHGISVWSDPSLGWRVEWAPDAEIEQLRYEFASGRFRVKASGFGPDAIYERVVTDKANEHLRARLPQAMRAPGYDPWNDPHLEHHVQTLIDIARRAAENGGAERTHVDRISSPRVSLSFLVREEKTIPLEGGEFSARIAAGTRIDLRASFDGPISSPRLGSIVIDFSRPLEIAKGQGERRSVLRSIDVRRATLTQGGQIELDYSIGAEQAIDGVRLLVALFALAAEPHADVGRLRPTQLPEARRQIQERIDNEIEPRVIEMIRENDSALPGLSLAEVFGVR